MSRPDADPQGFHIVTIGDVSIDWLWFEQPPGAKKQEGGPKWQGRPQAVTLALHGGAWYVDNFVRMLYGPAHRQRVHTYRRFEPHWLRAGDSRCLLHADTGYAPMPFVPCAEPAARPVKEAKHVYRIAQGPRYFGPADGRTRHPRLQGAKWDELFTADGGADGAEFRAEWEKLGEAAKNTPPAEYMSAALEIPCRYPADRPTVLVVHDEGNGFSADRRNWDDVFAGASAGGADAIRAILLNLDGAGNLVRPEARPGDQPGEQNSFWSFLTRKGHLSRTVVVVTADDLRRAGVRISKSLSWERTAYDFRSQVGTHPILQELTRARHVLVRFGVSGLLHYARPSDRCALYYYPRQLEGEYRRKEGGRMYGYNAIITAALACTIAKRCGKDRADADAVTAAIQGGAIFKRALASCRAYFRHGAGCQYADLDRRLGRDWDQLAAGEHFPPKLTQIAAYLLNDAGMDQGHVFGAQLDVAERRSWQESPFHPKGRDRADQGPRPWGADMVYPGGVVRELARRMLARLNEGRPKDRPWEALEAPCTVAGRAMIEIVRRGDGKPGDDDWGRFAAAVAAKLSAEGRAEVENRAPDPVKGAASPAKVRAYWAARKLVDEAYEGASREIDWDYGWPVCVRGFHEDVQEVARAVVKSDPDWVIIDSGSAKLFGIAEDIVRHGIDKALAKKPGGGGGPDERFPVGKFGGLVTVDRKEIESYRSIRNLVLEYLTKPSPGRPLSLAVFGPPGSGKSFGVKEIANSIDPAKYLPLEYNVSQFTSRDDLVRAFIVVRDKGVDGKVPLVFFDEFDSGGPDGRLGWLKYFLSVMQDGKYRFGGDELRIGPAILVFAGGTSHSYADFIKAEKAEGEELRAWQAVKGPDFVSRLRGHVDIIGPNRVPDSEDNVYVVRRAITLRSLLERHHKRRLFKGDKVAIDPNVLKALLKIYRYKHGIRSMEAVVEMSTLANAEKFDKAALPPKEQLYMHIEPDPGNPKQLYDLLEGVERG